MKLTFTYIWFSDRYNCCDLLRSKAQPEEVEGQQLVTLWEKQTVNKTIHRRASDSFDYPCNYRPLSSLQEQSTKALFESHALPQLWQTALSIRHNPTISTEEKKKFTLKMKWISVATQESKYSESPSNKCSLYQHDPLCQRMLCLSTCIC